MRILADEQLGGELLENLSAILREERGAEVDPLPEEMRGAEDSEVLEFAVRRGYDGILSEDVGMVRRALRMGDLRVFWVLKYDEKGSVTYIVAEVSRIKGFRERKEIEFL